jgi:Aspartyl protease
VARRLLLIAVCALLSGSLLLEGVAAAQTPAVVPIKVLRRGGDILALAPVTIKGRSYFFILDTGASTSVIGRRVSKRLGLRPTGRPVRVAGVFGSGAAQPVRIRRWQVGATPLPSLKIVSFDVGARGRIVGLLGSDVLARFGRISIDYVNKTLTLGG